MKALACYRKCLVLISKKQTKFCSNLHCNADNRCLFVNGKKNLQV